MEVSMLWCDGRNTGVKKKISWEIVAKQLWQKKFGLCVIYSL